MTDPIPELATALRAWLAARFGIADPAIRTHGYLAGDIYGTSAGCDLIEVSFVRPDTGATFSLRFDMAIHTDSGQLDDWSLHVDGADPADRDVLHTMFHPRERIREMVQNELRYPRFDFNGVAGRFSDLAEVAR